MLVVNSFCSKHGVDHTGTICTECAYDDRNDLARARLQLKKLRKQNKSLKEALLSFIEDHDKDCDCWQHKAYKGEV